MSHQYSVYVYIFLIITFSSLPAMEKKEDNELKTGINTVISTITKYHYQEKEEIISETQIEDYEIPYIYSIPAGSSGGFSLPEQYHGKVQVSSQTNNNCVGFLYYLMDDKKQFLTVIYANNGESFVRIFGHILAERIKSSKDSPSSTVFKYNCPDEDHDVIDQTVEKKLTGISHWMMGNLCCYKSTLTFFIDTKDSKKSTYQTATIKPDYFNCDNNPHYTDNIRCLIS